ncbi:MAG: EndoU domain-containing protein [Nitrosomonas sp.]|nr:EndoU domain-containing protein [Nitrosomonas sp.]
MSNWCKNPSNPSSGTNPDKTCDSSSQSCPLQEENWIDLEYLYCDGTGVAGARYQVINNDDGSVVAEGVLNNQGFAHCSLPLHVTNVSYNFFSDPPTLEYRIQPVANPEQVKIKPGWLDRMAVGISNTGSWVWETVQGDFNENQTIGQVTVNSVITMIPIVDQAGDIRDIAAQIKFLIWDKRYNDKWVWIALVITLIGLVPVLGSAAKGVLKVVAKGLKEAGKIPLKQVIAVLNKFHKGNAVKWLRKLTSDLPNYGTKIKKDFLVLLLSLRRKLATLATYLPTSLSKRYDDLVRSIDEVTKVAEKKIDEAVNDLEKGLNKSLDEDVDFASKGTTKEENLLTQKQSEPPPLEVILLSPEKEKKILYGERVLPSNELIGGHSPRIRNDPNFNCEILKNNPDGTTNVKFITQYQDGNLSKMKKSTLAPDSWSDEKIIETTKKVSNTPSLATRARDGATLHRQTIDGVEWEVIKGPSGEIVSSYPTGGTGGIPIQLFET